MLHQFLEGLPRELQRSAKYRRQMLRIKR